MELSERKISWWKKNFPTYFLGRLWLISFEYIHENIFIQIYIRSMLYAGCYRTPNVGIKCINVFVEQTNWYPVYNIQCMLVNVYFNAHVGIRTFFHIIFVESFTRDIRNLVVGWCVKCIIKLYRGGMVKC